MAKLFATQRNCETPPELHTHAATWHILLLNA